MYKIILTTEIPLELVNELYSVTNLLVLFCCLDLKNIRASIAGGGIEWLWRGLEQAMP